MLPAASSTVPSVLCSSRGTADDLAVFQLVQFNARDAGSAAQDQADAALARAGGNDRIHQPEEALRPDRQS